MLSESLWQVHRFRDHYQVEHEKRKAGWLTIAILSALFIVWLLWRIG